MSASGHETEMPTALRDVRSQGQSGKHVLALSFSGFDPVQTFLPDRDLSGCRYVQIIQIGPDPVFPRMAIERLKNCSASA